MKIKAIKIDVKTESIYIVEIEDSLEGMYKCLEADDFNLVKQLPNGDILHVDGMGLLKEFPLGAFYFQPYGGILSGHGLIMGTDSMGETIPVKSTILEISQIVKFVPVQLLKGIPRQSTIISLTDDEMKEYLLTGQLPIHKRPINPQ